MQIGFWEILIVVIIGMVLFASALPKLGRFLGSSVFKIKKGIEGDKRDDSSQSLPDNFS